MSRARTRSSPSRQRAESVLESLRGPLEREDDVIVAYLFGSASRGTQGPLSDVDVAVLLRDGDAADVAADRRLRLARIAAEALGDDRVDIVVLNGAPADLAYRVVRDGIVITSADDRARLAFEVRAIDRYLDLRPFRQAQDRALSDRLRDGRYGRPRRRT